jgi:Fuc2NAc and GlcNAc transferase
MSTAGIAATFLLALAASTGLTLAVRSFAIRRQMFDVPSARSSHSVPTPRGGGLAIVATTLIAAAALAGTGAAAPHLSLCLWLAGGVVAAVGWLDDRMSVAARWRLAVHAVAAVASLAILRASVAAWLDPLGSVAVVAEVGLAIGIVASINAFNFMDGIDGIAGMEAVFMCGAAALLPRLAGHGGDETPLLVAFVGAGAGFLVWNAPPARIFMGDVGSGYLGFALGALALDSVARGELPLTCWILLGGAFVVDATVTLARRVARGDRWYEPHRLHAYQHLARRWQSHRAVTGLYAAINVCWLLPWATYVAADPGRALFALACAFVPLIIALWFAGAGRPEVAAQPSTAIG